MEDTYLLAEGLREEDRVGTGIDRLLESTSASLFERGTVFTKKKPYNQSINQSIIQWAVTTQRTTNIPNMTIV